MQPLTARQQRVLDYIVAFIGREGFPPTRAEIARALGFRSANAAEDHLRALARKQHIALTPGASRGIRLLAAATGASVAAEGGDAVEAPCGGPDGLPLVGRVAAGAPILAAEHVEDHYQLDPRLFRARADYLLRVNGMSMRDAGILHGDLLLVERSDVADDNRIVVARVDDEVTVKRYRRRGDVVELLPENPDFEPIRIDLRRNALSIEGLVVGVIRVLA